MRQSDAKNTRMICPDVTRADDKKCDTKVIVSNGQKWLQEGAMQCHQQTDDTSFRMQEGIFFILTPLFDLPSGSGLLD